MPRIPDELLAYVSTYLAAIVLVIVALLSTPRRYSITSAEYRRFLCAPWRLATFVLSAAVITAAAPYSGDPTWDTADSILTSVLAYVTAPWAVGALARIPRHRDPRIVAVAVVLFLVPCWAYDLYILFRDGFYATAWAPNLWLSGGICLLAGLMWNLTTDEGGRPTFAFLRDAWLDEHAHDFSRLAPAAGLLAMPVLVMVAAFVYTAL